MSLASRADAGQLGRSRCTANLRAAEPTQVCTGTSGTTKIVQVASDAVAIVAS